MSDEVNILDLPTTLHPAISLPYRSLLMGCRSLGNSAPALSAAVAGTAAGAVAPYRAQTIKDYNQQHASRGR